jgi:hypothetical protein
LQIILTCAPLIALTLLALKLIERRNRVSWRRIAVIVAPLRTNEFRNRRRRRQKSFEPTEGTVGVFNGREQRLKTEEGP